MVGVEGALEAVREGLWAVIEVLSSPARRDRCGIRTTLSPGLVLPPPLPSRPFATRAGGRELISADRLPSPPVPPTKWWGGWLG